MTQNKFTKNKENQKIKHRQNHSKTEKSEIIIKSLSNKINIKECGQESFSCHPLSSVWL